MAATRDGRAFLQLLRRAVAALALVGLLAGCVRLSSPDNLKAALYDPEKTAATAMRHGDALTFASSTCPPPGTTGFLMPASLSRGRAGDLRQPSMRYSPGDRFNVAVFGSPELSGDYVINADGMVVLPYAGEVEAGALTNSELATRIERAMVRAGLFTREGLKLSVRPVQYSAVNVTVAGAVFFPGRYTIGGVKDSEKLDRALAKFGDNPLERFVPAALRAGGGVRPDADLSRIKVVRAGRTFTLDWRGAITGSPVDDMPLIDGDHVQVAEAGCFQSALVRPSQITPPGVRVVFSNLTHPALTNAQSIQSHQFAGAVPYGTRLLQGTVQANCVGGIFTTNAHRYAILISRNPKTMETEVIQRSIEELVRSADRDSVNPYLMPDDAIACYDSTVTEVRDVMAVVQSIILPANTLRGALPAK